MPLTRSEQRSPLSILAAGWIVAVHRGRRECTRPPAPSRAGQSARSDAAVSVSDRKGALAMRLLRGACLIVLLGGAGGCDTWYADHGWAWPRWRHGQAHDE